MSGSKDFVCDKLFYNNWLSCGSSEPQGLYWHNQKNPGYGWRMYPQDSAYMTLRTAQKDGGIKGAFGSNDKVGGYVHWTCNHDIGFLNSKKEWALRCDNERNVHVHGSCHADSVRANVVHSKSVHAGVFHGPLQLGSASISGGADATMDVCIRAPKGIGFGSNPRIVFDTGSGTVRAQAFAGDGANITHIRGRNVDGSVASAQTATASEKSITTPTSACVAHYVAMVHGSNGAQAVRTSSKITVNPGTGHLGVGTPAPNKSFMIHSAGPILSEGHAYTALQAASPLEDGVLTRVRGLSARTNEAGIPCVDVSEIERLFPTLVDKEHSGVTYGGLCVVLLQALKDLDKELQDIKTRLSQFEDQTPVPVPS